MWMDSGVDIWQKTVMLNDVEIMLLVFFSIVHCLLSAVYCPHA